MARGLVSRLLPGSVLGVILGGVLLEVIHSRADLVNALIRIEIGCESILLVSIHWWRLYRGTQTRLMPEPGSALTGSFAATSSTIAHAAVPIIAMYLLPMSLIASSTSARPRFISSCRIGKASRLLCQRSIRAGEAVLHAAVSSAGDWAILGKYNKRISDALFTKIVYIVTFLLGWYILTDWDPAALWAAYSMILGI